MSNLPPIGMCDIIGKDKNKFIHASGKTEGMIINGYLDEWGRPKCEMIVGTGKIMTYLTAVIDTGTYDTHIDIKLAKKIFASTVSEEKHSNPVYGNVIMPIYNLNYGFKEREDIYFKSDVFGMNFDADMLIGTHFILEFCDFRIFRKERRFELIFN